MCSQTLGQNLVESVTPLPKEVWIKCGLYNGKSVLNLKPVLRSQYRC